MLRTSSKSVSKVDTTKMLTPASASGAARAARMPVAEKSSVPTTQKQRKPRSARTSAGTESSAHTTESSSGVRVMEVTAPAAQDGAGASAPRRHTAS